MRRKISIIAVTLLGLLVFQAMPAPSAGEAGALQVIALKGRFLDPQGKDLAEYDYLEAGWKCRLMPEAQVELASLDGQKIYKASGPGIVEFDGADSLTLNGKPVARIEQQTEALAADAGTVQNGKLGALVMRGRDKITVPAKTPSGEIKDIPLYSGYYALVIGAGEYSKGWPALPNPVQDAREVSAMLQGLGWQVELIENPDWERLRKSLNSLITGPGRDKDRAIMVWFSGHGHTLEEADGSKLGYIVPVDAPDPGQDEMGFMELGISMRQVETVARRIKSKHVLMVFDSCFSGATFHTTRAVPPPFIQEMVEQPVRLFITAGNENEYVPDKSYFKTVFIQGVGRGYADRNKDGYVTGQELGAYLQENVINYSRKAQHPQYGKINNPKLDKGDFVFVVNPRKNGNGTRVASAGGGSGPAKVSATGKVGRVEVTGNVDQVRFSLTGSWFQTKLGTTLVIGQVPVGEHEVLAQKSGYEDWHGKVEIKEDGTAALDIRMKEIVALNLGKARIITDVGEVRVSLAGFSFETKAGKATLVGDIPAGDQEIVAVKDGYKYWSGNLTIKPNDVVQLFIQMEKEKIPTSAGDRKEKADELLAQAEEHLLAYRLTTPESGNALEKFSQVLEIDPDNKEAQAGLRRIVNAYLNMADKQIKAGNLDRADRYLTRAEKIIPTYSGLKSYWKQLARARKEATVRAAGITEETLKGAPAGEKVVVQYLTRSMGSKSASLMTLTLTFQGNRVVGEYDDKKGAITGKIAGREMVGSWRNEGGKPSGGFPEGDCRFVFTEDMKSFRGTWDIGDETGRWDGFQGRFMN